jgi:hypothetical protein
MLVLTMSRCELYDRANYGGREYELHEGDVEGTTDARDLSSLKSAK